LAYLGVASGFSVSFIANRLRRAAGIALCYHGILPAQIEAFAWQMAWLATRQCSKPPVDQTASGCEENVASVRVTFDDAFANLLDNALPLLEQHHIPAIVFAVADNLGCYPRWAMPAGHPEAKEETMTPEQLKSLAQHPLIRIGSHTLTHPDLTKVHPQQAKRELVESKAKLEQLIDQTVDDLALPHGAYNEQVLALAKEAGYKKIYTLDPRPFDPKAKTPVIGRFSMSPDVWKMEFILSCSGAYAWLYPWRRFVRRFRGLMHSFAR